VRAIEEPSTVGLLPALEDMQGIPDARVGLGTGVPEVVERTEDVLLPHNPPLHRRGFATAVLRIGGARVSALSAHLSLDPAERYEQAGLLLDRIAGLGERHVIVGGDFNEPPERPGFRRLAGRLRDAWAVKPWGGGSTNDSAHPTQRIDAVFTTPGIDVLGCGVPYALPGITDEDLRAATDHLPVLAALRVPAADR